MSLLTAEETAQRINDANVFGDVIPVSTAQLEFWRERHKDLSSEFATPKDAGPNFVLIGSTPLYSSVEVDVWIANARARKRPE